VAQFYWCRSCGLFSTVADVARWGIGTYPYMCPGCVVTDSEGKLTIPPGTNALIPWPVREFEAQYSGLPEAPVPGGVYPPTDRPS
jgi:hypothetical protein